MKSKIMLGSFSFLTKVIVLALLLMCLFHCDTSAQRGQLNWSDVMRSNTANTFAGWNASGRASVLSGTEVTAQLSTYSNTLKGLVPASGGGTINFLRADGTWAAAPGVTDLTYTSGTRTLNSSTGTGVALPLFSSTIAGLAPLSGGGTTNFLRADGTWIAAPGVTDLTYTSGTRTLNSSTGTGVALPLFSSTIAGLAPLSGGGTTNYLRADGTWAAPSSATNLSYTSGTRTLNSSTGTGVALPLFTTTEAGLTPLSGGGTSNYLRADGTWAAPSASAGGSNTQVQFNNSGVLAGDPDVTFTGGNTLNTTNLAISQGQITSGTYTPTLVNSGNVTSSTAFQCQYMRVGNVVTVSGKFNMTATSAGTTCELFITLPISSDITSNQNLGGTASMINGGGDMTLGLTGEPGFDRVSAFGLATTTGAGSYGFTFTYLIQ